MAIFSKQPPKKPEAAAEPKTVRPAAPGSFARSARELVGAATARSDGRDPGTLTGGSASAPTTRASVIELAARKPAVEIEYANAGLCGALENAALMFASGQLRAARQLLQEAVAQDEEARTSSLAWLCLFDLLHRTADRGQFDKMAFQYVVQFERSAPAWEEMRAPATGEGPRASAATITLPEKLTAAQQAQLEPLRRIAKTDTRELKLELGLVSEFDDAGARLLAERLADVRRRGGVLLLQRPEKLREALENAVHLKGKGAGQGAWMLLLELLQWLGQQAGFDDRAVEYAVTFEMSPPSWEPPGTESPGAGPGKGKARTAASDVEVLSWSDEVTGSSPKEMLDFLEFAQTRSNVVLDMSGLLRVDFASAGALSNAIHRLEAQRKSVQIAGASPIVRALLLLVGVRPDLLVVSPTT